jgi:hypothetical protein
MPRFRHLLIGTLGVAGLLAVPAAPARAATTLIPPGIPVPWSTSHVNATASGTRTLVQDPFGVGKQLRVAGTLTVRDGSCYSVWVRWNRDLLPGMYSRVATQCGSGSAAIGLVHYVYSPTQSGDLKLCRGGDSTTDCAAPVRLFP